MLKYIVIAIALAMPTVAQADLLQGLRFYQDKNYSQAKTEFESLLPLGNSGAAFNLAVMSMYGQGEPVDFVRAYAYFSLAKFLEQTGADKALQHIETLVTAEQKQQAILLFSQLQRTSLPPYKANEPYPTRLQPLRAAQTKVEPDYPLGAAKKGISGFSIVQFVINKQGNVVFTQTQRGLPEKVFNKTSERAIKKWKYKPGPAVTIQTVQLDYSLSPGSGQADNQDKKNAKLINSLRQDLWPFALNGSAEHQYHTAAMFDYLQNERNVYAKTTTGTAQPPTLADLATRTSGFGLPMPAFLGEALVQVNAHSQVDSVQPLSGAIAPFTGKTIAGLQQGVYRITPFDEHFGSGKDQHFSADKMYVEPLNTLPQHWTSTYWLDQAARNGMPEAQKARAMQQPYWANYLQQKQDANALGWHAIELMTQNKTQEAKVALETAKNAGFETTAELEILFQ